jgi:hypothetical protein
MPSRYVDTSKSSSQAVDTLQIHTRLVIVAVGRVMSGRLPCVKETMTQETKMEEHSQNPSSVPPSERHSDNPDSGEPEATGYVPTIEELRQLALYWAREYLDIHVLGFMYDQVGDYKRLPYALGRLDRIAEVAGEDLTRQAVSQVKEEERKKWGERLWDCYVKNDKESRGDLYPPHDGDRQADEKPEKPAS